MASTDTSPRPSRFRRFLSPGFLVLQAGVLLLLGTAVSQVGAQAGGTLSAPFDRLTAVPKRSRSTGLEDQEAGGEEYSEAGAETSS